MFEVLYYKIVGDISNKGKNLHFNIPIFVSIKIGALIRSILSLAFLLAESLGVYASYTVNNHIKVDQFVIVREMKK